jgi:hypothetical protein
MIEQWYEEAIEYGLQEFETLKGIKFVIYKGFKITKFEGFKIEDIRKSDFYEDVDPNHFILLKEKGFIKGADDLSYDRNIMRVKTYIKKLEVLYTEKYKLIKVKKTNTQKFENLINGIYKYIDLLKLYKAKVLQHEKKYEIPTTE